MSLHICDLDKKFAKEMKKLVHQSRETEGADGQVHFEADEVLVDFLLSIGADETVTAYRNLIKTY